MKPNKNPARQALILTGQPIRCGLATLPWCDYQAGWILPNGPRQKSRVVKSGIQAQMFAERMHDLMVRRSNSFARN